MVYPEFIYGGFILDNYYGNYEDFPFLLIKVVSLGIFYITMISLSESLKLRYEIGCMEGT